MNNTGKQRLGRPPDRHDAIYTELACRIVTGKYPLRSRLPTRRDLALEFDASSRTVQAVLNELASAGFTRPDGARGTFVEENPPHLHRLALVFDTGEDYNQIHVAIEKEAQQLTREGWNLEIIHLPAEPSSSRQQSLKLLSGRVHRHLYAGLVFTQAPKKLINTPVLQTPGVPRVILSSMLLNFESNLSIYTEKIKDEPVKNFFLKRALEKAKELGRTRVALFQHLFEQHQQEKNIELIRQYGLKTSSAWVHAVHLNMPQEACAIAELMFSLPKKQRPDVFIVDNDNLVGMLTKGIEKFAPPGEVVPVISHCNYPWMPPVHVPVIWLGLSIRELLLQSFRLIEQDRRRLTPSKEIIHVDLKFEHEIQKVGGD